VLIRLPHTPTFFGDFLAAFGFAATFDALVFLGLTASLAVYKAQHNYGSHRLTNAAAAAAADSTIYHIIIIIIIINEND